MTTRRVEICVNDPGSARAAAAGGADRVELCVDLGSGGQTPSLGLIGGVVSRSGIATHVLIRARPGDFVYDEDELAAMEADVRAAIGLGAAGVVVGVLGPDGRVDVVGTTRLVVAARPAGVAFHRAIDLTPDPLEAIDTLVALGIDRVLTAGGLGPARGNLAALRAIVGRAAGRIEVMVGGGIAEADLPGLLDATGADAVHLHSGVVGPSPPPGPFGAGPPRVESDKVRRVVGLVRGGSSRPGPSA